MVVSAETYRNSSTLVKFALDTARLAAHVISRSVIIVLNELIAFIRSRYSYANAIASNSAESAEYLQEPCRGE